MNSENFSPDDRINKAWDMVSRLCQPRGSEGSKEWMMSIPADFENDPDLVIAEGLKAGRDAMIACLAAELASQITLEGKLPAPNDPRYTDFIGTWDTYSAPEIRWADFIAKPRELRRKALKQ